jgi:cysteine desulfurase
LVDRIRLTLATTVPDVQVVGDPLDRLPHIVTFSCLYVDGEALLTALDRRGFAVSSGSSCTSSTLTPSHVLVAMGALKSRQRARIAAPRDDQAEVDQFLLAVLPDVVADVPGRAGRDRAASHGEPLVIIDCRGRRCPLPIIDLARAISTRWSDDDHGRG